MVKIGACIVYTHLSNQGPTSSLYITRVIAQIVAKLVMVMYFQQQKCLKSTFIYYTLNVLKCCDCEYAYLMNSRGWKNIFFSQKHFEEPWVSYHSAFEKKKKSKFDINPVLHNFSQKYIPYVIFLNMQNLVTLWIDCKDND